MKKLFLCLALAGVILICLPASLWALTAQEIMDEAAKQGLGENFRAVLSIQTEKGHKSVSKQSLWLMGQMENKVVTFFLDFVEPEESKGLRFLLIVPIGKESKSFMYMPATQRTLPLAGDDPTVDLGGTGLTMEDVQVFVPRGGEKMELSGEEKIGERECYVVKVTLPEGQGERTMWVTKKGFLVVKSEMKDSKGKLKRSLKVTEFFKTAKGNEFPRKEEISIPERGVRIILNQEHAVFGITIPDELMDPKTFGTFKWQN